MAASQDRGDEVGENSEPGPHLLPATRHLPSGSSHHQSCNRQPPSLLCLVLPPASPRPHPPRRPQCLRFGARRLFGHLLSSPVLAAAVLGQPCLRPGRGLSWAMWRGSCAHCPSPAGEGLGHPGGAGRGGARGTQARAGTRHTSCHRGTSGMAQPREAGQGPPSCPPANSSCLSGQA